MKNKYRRQHWYSIVWAFWLTLLGFTQLWAQTVQPPVIQWQRVIEPESTTSFQIVKASNGGYAAVNLGQILRLSDEGASLPNALTLTQPTYNCQTGAITFNTSGGDGSPITYTAPGITRAALTDNFGTVERELRNDPKPILIQATQSGQTVSYTFDFGAYCSNPPANPLQIVAPSVTCGSALGATLVINTSGGDGSPISYAIPGVELTSPTSSTVDIFKCIDINLPLSIQATQSGYTATYSLDLKQYCPGIQIFKSLEVSPIPDLTVKTGQTLESYELTNYFKDPNFSIYKYSYLNHYWFTASGMPEGITYSTAGSGDGSGGPNGLVVKFYGKTSTAPGTYIVNVAATNGYCDTLKTSFRIVVVESSGSSPLTLTQPTYNCQTGAITFNTSGGDGSPITYTAPGITRAALTDNFGTVERELRNDPKPILIQATQSGQTTSFTFDLKEYCSTPPPHPDLGPLADLYNSTNGPNWTIQTNWLRDNNPCGWYGVSCYSNGRVEKINLGDNNLNGSLPATLGDLAYLRHVDFRNNRLSGCFPKTLVSWCESWKTVIMWGNPDLPGGGDFGSYCTNQSGACSDGYANLILTSPTYNCQTGAITFNTARGDGTTIVYTAPGVTRASVTDNFGTIEQGLRNDPKLLLIQATQSGRTTSLEFDFDAYCKHLHSPSPIDAYIPDKTITVNYGSPNWPIGGSAYNPALDKRYLDWSITASGLPPGMSVSGGVVVTTFYEVVVAGNPTVAGVYPVTVTATNQVDPTDGPFTTQFIITVIDPTSSSSLSLVAPTYNCSTGAFTFNTSGGDGSPIEFRAAGITDWTTNSNQFVDKESRTASDVQPFMLMARQSGYQVSYSWDLKAACGRARVGVAEGSSDLSVRVLGNPAGEQLRVRIEGVEGQAVELELSDLNGRLLDRRRVESAGAYEEQVFGLEKSGAKLLLLRAATTQQTKTVRIIKQ